MFSIIRLEKVLVRWHAGFCFVWGGSISFPFPVKAHEPRCVATKLRFLLMNAPHQIAFIKSNLKSDTPSCLSEGLQERTTIRPWFWTQRRIKKIEEKCVHTGSLVRETRGGNTHETFLLLLLLFDILMPISSRGEGESHFRSNLHKMWYQNLTNESYKRNYFSSAYRDQRIRPRPGQGFCWSITEVLSLWLLLLGFFVPVLCDSSQRSVRLFNLFLIFHPSPTRHSVAFPQDVSIPRAEEIEPDIPRKFLMVVSIWTFPFLLLSWFHLPRPFRNA